MSYDSGHPCYYALGGDVLSIKQIWKLVHASGYKGYRRDEIGKLYGNDPKLKALKEEVISSLNKNISGYRKLAFSLHRYRLEEGLIKQEPCCDVHTNISLKHNHIYNDLAHLTYIDKQLSGQLELF